MEKNFHQFRTMDLVEIKKINVTTLQEVTGMTLQSIITMILCLLPIWGGLISYLMRLIKLESAEN